MKKRVLFLTVALFVCAAALGWTEPRLVVQEIIGDRIDVLKYTVDGKFLLTADSANSAKIWDVASGKLIRSYVLGCRSVCDISPDGRHFIYVAKDGIFKKSDVPSGKEVNVFSGEIKGNCSAAYSQNGYFYAIATNANDINVYSAKTDKLFCQLSSNKFDYLGMQIVFACEPKSSEDGRGVFIVKTGTVDEANAVEGYSLYSGKLAFFHSNILRLKSEILRVATSLDGHSYAICDRNCNVFIESFDVKTVKTFSMERHRSHVMPYIAFNGDGRFSALIDEKEIQTWDFSNSPKVVSTIKTKRENYIIAFSPDKKQYSTNAYMGEIEFFSTVTNESIARISSRSYVGHPTYYPQNDSLYFVIPDAKVVFYDKSFDKIAEAPYVQNYLVTPVAFFEGGFYYPKENKGGVCVCSHNFITKQNDREILPINSDALRNFIFCKNAGSQYLAYRDRKNGEAYVCDIASKKIIKSFQMVDDGFSSGIVGCLDGTFYAFTTSDGNMTIFDCKIKKSVVLKEKKYPVFSPDGKYLAVHDEKKSGIQVYDTATWKILHTVDVVGAFKPLAMSYDGRYLVHGTVKCVIYDLKENKTVNELPVEGECFFSMDNSKIYVSVGSSKGISVYSVKTGRLMAWLMSGMKGEWLAGIPEGFFKGDNKGATDFVHVVDGMKVSDLDQYGEVFYRPDLVSARLRGEDISGVVESIIPNGKTGQPSSALGSVLATGEPPLVRFVDVPSSTAKRDVDLVFTVQEQGGGVGGVFVSVNGKVVKIAEGSRRLELAGGSNATASNQGNLVKYGTTVTLSNGDNVIQAFATNKAGLVESRRVETKIVCKGEVSKPSLWLLAVGVNKYKARGVSSLNYAVPDVQALSSSLKTSGAKIYSSVNVSELIDDKVTEEGIASEFSKISRMVKPDDVFIFYVSGHGISYNGDYYFIPANFDGNISSAVSKKFIMENLQKIRAQKTLIILDTCYSGAVLNSNDTTAYERLSRFTGQAIFAASSDEQTAREGYKGHGVFTYALLEGLAGGADLMKDGKVSLMELAAYLSGTVPSISYEAWGYKQVPWHDTHGQDFPLVGE